ncbi:unnamed protein product [Candidula unifasciata]|uniref:Lysosome-associated membrane glycoprotein 5 n=1 Tax=Candidula unifasciata TaxID=100452 RepID=A0A8S3ZB76_9EUPU|nr:unnamed protein product [Candidula unifasciata]
MSPRTIVYASLSILLLPTVLEKSFIYSSENGIPCIRLDITFTMVFTADNDVFEASTSRTDSDVQSTLDSCDYTSLALAFSDDTHWSLWFHQTSNGSDQLDSSVLFVPTDVFQNNATGPDTTLLNDEAPVELFNTLQSYKCDNLKLFQYSKTASASGKPNYIVQVAVSSFQVQTFDLNGRISSPNVFCLQDNTTNTTSSPYETTIPSTHNSTSASTDILSSTATVSQSTETPTFNTTMTPTPSKPPLNNYTVHGENVTCILLQGAFKMNINYPTNMSQTSTQTASVDIPADATSTGNCSLSLDSQSLVISFFKDWSLEFVFTLEDLVFLSATSATSDASYGITNITLTYVVTPELFPESAIPPGSKVTVFPHGSSEADYPRKASNKAFYKCDRDVDVKLQAGVTLQVSELHFTAFNNNENITFAGNAENCLSDEPTSHTVPIIVGCSLAGLAVVVVTVYTIGKCRNKQRRSYFGI